MKIQFKESPYSAWKVGVTYEAVPIFADGKPMVQVPLPGTKICLRIDWDKIIVIE